MRRLLGLLVAVLAATTLVLPRADAQALPSGVLRPVNPHQVLPTRDATVSSLNWSGYATVAPAGHPITAVSTHFIVPTVKRAPAGFSSTWAGIGGYNTQDLIQAGTESDTAGAPYAWYEILPASETPITSGCVGDNACTVRPGDNMTVTITSQGGDNWLISMVNANHWTWSLNLSYASTFSSAEWILEAPTVGAQTVLANVGVQRFVPTNTYTIDGVTKVIKQGNPIKIILSPGLVNEATPSALNAAGNAFNDCAYKNSCAAP
jgi:hypothetical protein